MKTKHTPGEWKAEPLDVHVSVKLWRVLQGTKIICKLDSYDRYNTEANIEEEANAKLIAAAPDMFTALMVAKAHLEYAIEFGAGAGGESKAIEIIDRAIKKATE